MNPTFSSVTPWLLGLPLIAIALVLLCRPVRWLWRFGLRSAAGLALLALFRPIGSLLGVILGVNWVNALVLGLLGAPGFGLLLMLQWILQTA